VWTNLSHLPSSNVIIINSNEELGQYITCAKDSYPEIDFSKHSLMLIKGKSYYPIAHIDKKLMQLSANEYRLDFELQLFTSSTTVCEWWTVALVVVKLKEASKVSLKTTNTGTACQLINIDYPVNSGALYIINSQEELENYVSCIDGNFPAIDFSKHTFLISSGYAYYIPAEITVADFQLLSSCEFQLDINIFLMGLGAMDKWVDKFIIKKTDEDSSILLNVNYIELWGSKE
jgi:hypothetical protein